AGIVISDPAGKETAVPGGCPKVLADLVELPHHPAVYRPFRIRTVLTLLARRHAGENLHRFVYSRDGVDVELLLLDCLDDILTQDKMLDIRLGNDYGLVACEAPRPADVVEPLDLEVGAADGLHLASLVH